MVVRFASAGRAAMEYHPLPASRARAIVRALRTSRVTSPRRENLEEPAVLLYILRRLLSAISVVIVTLVASFALFFVAPTDPAGVICGPKCTPERLADISASLDLDKPA